MKAAIYVRISRDRTGAGLGVERQEKECREKAQALGWEVVGVYPDNDVSAYSGKRRPHYERLLKDIAAGRIDAVLCWHTDRLHRSTTELERFIEVAGHVPTQAVMAGPLDLATASGRMSARILGAVARHESEHKAERIAAKHRELRESGTMVGARSFGWALGEGGRLSGDLDPEESDLLREAADLILGGKSSPYRIAADWNARGITTTKGGRWTHANLKIALRNPKIAGLRAHKGEVVLDGDGQPVRGQWTAILEVDTWRSLCAVLSRKSHMRAGSTKHLLSGLISCVCGAVMHGESKTDYKSKKPISLYRCSRCTTQVRKEVVEPVVIRSIASAALFGASDGFAASNGTPFHSDRLAALRASETRLLDLVEAEVFSISEIAGKRAAIRAEIAEEEAKIDAGLAQGAEESAIADLVRELWTGGDVSFAKAAETKKAIQEKFVSLDFDRQRTLIGGLLDVTIQRGRTDRVQVTHLVATSLNDEAVPA